MYTIHPSPKLVSKVLILISENDYGKRGKDDGTKENQFHGMLGQATVTESLGIPLPEKSSGFDGGFDLVFNGLKIDIKTMTRNTVPRVEFVNNFCAHQFEYKCDAYIFCSLKKDNNQVTICGWLPKHIMKRVAKFHPKGTKRQKADGTFITLKMDTYEIANSDLYQVENRADLIEQLFQWSDI